MNAFVIAGGGLVASCASATLAATGWLAGASRGRRAAGSGLLAVLLVLTAVSNRGAETTAPQQSLPIISRPLEGSPGEALIGSKHTIVTELPTVVGLPKKAAVGPPPGVARRAARIDVAAPAQSAVPDEIFNFRAGSLSAKEMQVTVDYAYGGGYGTDEIFLHAAALSGEDIKSRVPGTGFPGQAVQVGRGSVTLTITRWPVGDPGALTSTNVRVCLVSLKRRAAFLCRNFSHAKNWE